jgi:hypothetical protein
MPVLWKVTTPGWDDEAVPVEHAEIVAAAGSPLRIGPETLARAALLTCAHFLPVGRARDLLAKLCAIDVSTGFLAGIRGRAARRLEKKFLAHMRVLLTGAPVLHADETPGRAAGSLAYVHVACAEYLTLMHVGDRTKETIDAGGVLTEFTGVLVRDGYAGYEHLKAVHAWCGAHLLRDLRALSDLPAPAGPAVARLPQFDRGHRQQTIDNKRPEGGGRVVSVIMNFPTGWGFSGRTRAAALRGGRVVRGQFVA